LPAGSLTNRRLLIVEDDGLNRFYLNKVLTRAGAQVVTAECGEDALELYGEDPEYHIIVMDVGLPGIDGVETARQILEKRNDQRIVLLTAHTSDSDMKTYEKIRLSGILAKPIREDELVSYLNGKLDE
jgi:CheY-like chemotaxis protein